MSNAEISPNWRKEVLDSVINDIKKAEFVSIDLEFSGLFKVASKRRVFQEYFQECVTSATNFAAIQLGVCPVWRSSKDPEYQERTGSSGDPDVWCFAPYNFNIFPNSKKIYSVDTSTLTWLSDNGFSFDNWIKKGFDYAPLALLQNMALYMSSNQLPFKFKKVGEEGIQRVISAIVDYEKPIIVHNGLLDILHIHEKFIDTLPLSSKEFCSEWLRLFSGGLYDTKHIATSGKYSIMQLFNDSGTILNALHSHLHALRQYRSRFSLAPRYYKSESDISSKKISQTLMTGDYYFNTSNETSTLGKTKLHEAGYDALITAQVFLMQNELYHDKATKGESSAKNNDTEKTSSSLLGVPGSWLTSDEFGKRFRNVLELVKISPGMLHLDIVAKQQSLCKNIKYVAFSNASLSTKDISFVPTKYNSTKVSSQNSLPKRANTLETTKTTVKKQNTHDPLELNIPTATADYESAQFEVGEIETQCFPLKSATKDSGLPSATWAIPLQNFIKTSKPSLTEIVNSSVESCDVKEPKISLNIAKFPNVRTFSLSKQKFNGNVKKQKNL
ncbi:uncharacterized protein LOC128882628 isoform X2 [Hylaeus volcanicus]|uniref:uncharacterized protein LOC128882628 isoform X2 n=1 Tax=Hylaeus volcanicus TaxID=313075 RepID=UPI0023B84BBE|nr:uncharacterized protein LOC128882628 isoform X2 [Hylaeus volcanicus]